MESAEIIDPFIFSASFTDKPVFPEAVGPESMMSGGFILYNPFKFFL